MNQVIHAAFFPASRHYPPAFREFLAVLALELQSVAWAGGFAVWPCRASMM